MKLRPRTVVVVGAGVTGLSAAQALLSAGSPERPIDVTVLEASGRAGGKLHTVQLDGMPVEAGADSFVVRKPWAVDLCRELGLEDEVVVPGSAGAYVWTAGALVPFPDRAPFGIPADFGELLRWEGLPRRHKLRALLDLIRPSRREEPDESLAALLRRRLGAGVARVMVEPLLAGLHAADPMDLSVRATFPELEAWERQHGSLLRGARTSVRAAREEKGRQPMFATVWGGLGRLAERLVERIGGDRVRLDHPVSAIDPAQGRYRVRAAGGEFPADCVVIATPAFEAARLLEGMTPGAAEGLASVEYASTAVVLLAYGPGTAGQLPEGTGFVVPDGEGTMTACTWTSRKWPNPAFGDRAVLRSFVGRAGDERYAQLSDRALSNTVAAEVEAAVGIGSDPTATKIIRWSRSMPQYRVGHLELVEGVEKALSEVPGVFVAGSALRGVGIADCVRQGREAADRVVAYLANGETGTAGSQTSGEARGDMEQEAVSWTS